MNVQIIPELSSTLVGGDDAYAGGVSWGAVLAGAATAAALSFILLLLGVGLGLSAVSPYAYPTSQLSGATIAWVAFMQLAASAVGGYMAGRLRVKWARVHGDEVFFRDTAHGLLAWAVATLLTVAVLAGGVKAALGGAIDTGAAAANVAAPLLAADSNPANKTSYYADMLLRSPSGDAPSELQRAELLRIVSASLADNNLTAEDRAYLVQTHMRRTGLSNVEAQRHVDDIYARAAKAAAHAKSKALSMADEARKAASHSALWMFIALLLGAFVASLSATFGGRCRDDIRVHFPSGQ